MGCNKIKNNCLDKFYATCVYYELSLPNISSLEDCVTIEETTKELYDFVVEIKEVINLNTLISNYSEYEDLFIAQILKAQEDKIVELQEKVETLENQNLCDQDIDGCNLNLEGLVDVCGEQPQTVRELLQILINQITE